MGVNATTTKQMRASNRFMEFLLSGRQDSRGTPRTIDDGRGERIKSKPRAITRGAERDHRSRWNESRGDSQRDPAERAPLLSGSEHRGQLSSLPYDQHQYSLPPLGRA